MLAVNVSKDAKSNRNVPAPVPSKAKKNEKSEDDVIIESLMTEIEEDLRGEELSKLWKQYGNIVIGVVVVIVLAVAGWQLWRQNQETQRIEAAQQFEGAIKLIEEGKVDDAMTAYAALAQKKGQGFAALAQLQKASLALKKNDLPGALAAYKALSEDATADVLFRDLARILRAMHGLETENPLELEASLKPMLDPSNSFSSSATELTALLAFKQGDNARAQVLAEGLAADINTAAGVRQRAEELAAVFKAAAGNPAPAAK